MGQEENKSSRKQQKELTRKKLLDTARKAFLAKGIESTSTRQISKESGVAVGTLFAHFPDKLSLVKEVFFEELDRRLIQAAPVLHGQQEPHSYLWHFAGHLYPFYDEYREFARMAVEDSLMRRGFIQDQIAVLTQSLTQRFESADIDEEMAQIFAENMAANFLQILLDGLLQENRHANQWLARLVRLNRPFEVAYLNAKKKQAG